MTWALCFHCGEIKFGAICPCPKCNVASTGDISLDILFSDHRFSRATLEKFGQVIQRIQSFCAADDGRFWAFLKYVSDNYPEILTITLKPPFDAKVPAILAMLALPKFELELAARHRILQVYNPCKT